MQIQPSPAGAQPSENLTCLISEKEITLKTKLGGGTFGVVMMGEWTTCTGRIVDVACKILKEDPKQTGTFDDFIKEVNIVGYVINELIINERCAPALCVRR